MRCSSSSTHRGMVLCANSPTRSSCGAGSGARFDDIGRIAAEIVDDASNGGEIAGCDFVNRFATRLPL